MAKVLAYAGDVRRFANAKALSAFMEICPRQRQSGSSVKRHDDLQNRPCGIEQSFVQAGAGGAASQSILAGLWGQDESERPGTEDGGRGSDAQAGASDLRGGEVRKAV